MIVKLIEKGTIVSKAIKSKAKDLTPALTEVFAKSFGVSESTAKVMARGRGVRPVAPGSLTEAGKALGLSSAAARQFARGRGLVKAAVTRAEPAAGQFKGGNFPSSDYGYVGDPKDPETWSLLLTLTPGGTPDPASVRAAVAAIDPGNGAVPTVDVPEEDLPGAKSKLATAWKKAGLGDDLPAILTTEALRRAFVGMGLSEHAAAAAAKGRDRR